MDTNLDDRVSLADIKKFCEKNYINFEERVLIHNVTILNNI